MTRGAWRSVVAGLGLALAACGGESGRTPEPSASPPPPESAAREGVEPGEASAPVAVDPALPDYARTSGVSGSLTAMGSDTLNNLMTLWSEGFQRLYPNVRIQIEGKGSSTAPPALIDGLAQLGPMSREMRSSEIERFEQTFGYAPTRVRVALDALAVYVHRDNPLERLTIPQVDAIFSDTRTCGAPRPIDTWGDLGLSGEWAARPISTYGRNSASGTYGYFKEHALCGGDFRSTVKEQPGSASVIQGVSADRFGMGYSGIGYRTSGVKTIDLAREEGGDHVETDPEAVYSGEYPLARYLYVYVNKPPQRELDPLLREFSMFVLSEEGQRVVVKDGYLPLSPEVVAAEREALE